MAALLQIDQFVYNDATAHHDFPIYAQRFELFLDIQNIGYTIIAADLTATPPVTGETTIRALHFLLHVGGSKILEIFNASPKQPPLDYVAFKKILTTRFTVNNLQVADFNFRGARQLPKETLANFATRLRALAITATIAEATIDSQILSVIRTTTDHYETRMKCLENATTLENLLEWRKQHDVKSKCAAAMEIGENPESVQQINSSQRGQASNSGAAASRLCYTCGYEYPHKGDTECPAKGKPCSKCRRIGHFASVCQNGNTGRNQTVNSSHRTYRSERSNQNDRSEREPFRQLVHQQSQRGNNFSRPSNNSTRLPHNNSNSSASFRASNTGQTIRNITDLSESELVNEFEEFFRQRQLSSTLNNNDSIDGNDTSSIRRITTNHLSREDEHIELINELSASQLAACPRTFVAVGKSRIEHLIRDLRSTGTNLNILSRSTFEAMGNRPLLRQTKVKAYGFHSKIAVPLLGEFLTRVSFRHRHQLARYIILDGEADNIIGYNTATLLGIVQITCDNNLNQNSDDVGDTNVPINTVDSGASSWIHPFKTHPELFTGKLGLLKDYLVDLQVDPMAKPIQQPAYPVPFGLLEMTKDKLDYLEANGIISRAKDEIPTWISPLQPVAKVDAKHKVVGVRITCNAKQLNKKLIKIKRHIPSITELTNDLAGDEYFSKLDFNDAFNQMLFNERARELTAMATVWGIYYWNRMNMGISIASEIFQEAMEKLLEDIPNIKVALDDVMIHTKTKDEGQRILTQCLDRIRESGMTLNKEKCEFVKQEITFFGVTVSKDGVKPKKSKYEDLQNCDPPTTVKEVQSFLGLTGYFKNRSPYKSSIDKPLRNLLKSGTSFKWEKEENEAYKRLKEIVIEEEMAFFDHKKDTELYVDAGPNGCSSFLTQIDREQQTVKLVRCDSHAFNEAELRYSHIEKEAFACVWACKTNHIYVYGRHFKLITDALSVKKIFEEDKVRKRTPIRFIRWRSDLSVYDVEFIHREGSKNIADFLSRRFAGSMRSSNITSFATNTLEAQINRIAEACRPTCISLEQLLKATLNDLQLVAISKELASPIFVSNYTLKSLKINKYFRNVYNELSLTQEGIILRNDVIVMPESLCH